MLVFLLASKEKGFAASSLLLSNTVQQSPVWPQALPLGSPKEGGGERPCGLCLRVFVASVPVRLLEQTTEGSGFSEPQYLLVCLILFVI